MTQKPYIFISYAHKDSNTPYGEFSFFQFTNDLQDSGFNLWIDTEALLIGGNWHNNIKEAVKECDAFFLIVTENSAQSRYIVDTEVGEAQKAKKTIIPIIAEESALKKFNGVEEKQGVLFTGDYPSAYKKLVEQFEHLKVQRDYRPVQEMLDDGNLNIEDATKHVRQALTFRSYDALGLLVARSPYRMAAYLVAPPKARLKRQNKLQIFLQFTGETNKGTFYEYLDYVKARKKNLWTLLVRGPYDKEARGTWEYTLDDEDKDVWREAVRFIADNMRAVMGDKRFDIYLNTPNALTMIFADQVSELHDGTFTVYNYQRDSPPKSKRYKPVYQKSKGK